jgi:hypothetical protein
MRVRSGRICRGVVLEVAKVLNAETREVVYDAKVDELKAKKVVTPGGEITELEISIKGKGTSRGNIEVLDANKGLILCSPDGSRWLVFVSNAGTLGTVKVS